MKGRRALTLLALVHALTAPVPGTEPDAQAVLKRLDELYRSDASYAEVALDIVTAHWQRTLEARVWTAGMTKTFIRILSPRKERGVGTLRIDQQMWNYLPKTNKIIKIPPSMMMGSWMGSDFTNDDIVKEHTFSDDYTFALFSPADADPALLYLECRPREGRPIIWARVVVAVRRDDLLPMRQVYYDDQGRAMRELIFREVKPLGGRVLPTVLEMVPRNKPGHKTIIRYQKIEFNPVLGADVFSIRHLRTPL